MRSGPGPRPGPGIQDSTRDVPASAGGQRPYLSKKAPTDSVPIPFARLKRQHSKKSTGGPDSPSKASQPSFTAAGGGDALQDKPGNGAAGGKPEKGDNAKAVSENRRDPFW